MGGGLLQLLAVGIQDIYIIGNPQITFFKTIFKKHTHFALESNAQTIDGRPDFGQQIEVTIDRKGDLVKDIIIEMLLPALPTGYFWTNGIGNVLIQQVDLEIGGQLIDRHYSEWIDIWSQLTVNESKIGSYNAMVCNKTETGSELNAANPLRLYVPMFFWFNRDYAMALPLIALQYHTVVLKINLRDFNNCYRNNTDIPLPKLDSSLYKIKEFIVWADYILLDMEERRKFASTSHEYLIDQLQFAGDEFISKTRNSISKALNFNHPIKELYWVHVLNDYGQQNIYTGNRQLNYSLPTDSLETFNQGVLQLNGVERFEKRNANYFRLVQNYQFHSRYSDKNIYSYSFGIFPEKPQPTGCCNFSKFTNINLYLDYNNILHNENDMILKVFAINYNILRIISGMAGLAFSN